MRTGELSFPWPWGGLGITSWYHFLSGAHEAPNTRNPVHLTVHLDCSFINRNMKTTQFQVLVESGLPDYTQISSLFALAMYVAQELGINVSHRIFISIIFTPLVKHCMAFPGRILFLGFWLTMLYRNDLGALWGRGLKRSHINTHVAVYLKYSSMFFMCILSLYFPWCNFVPPSPFSNVGNDNFVASSLTEGY